MKFVSLTFAPRFFLLSSRSSIYLLLFSIFNRVIQVIFADDHLWDSSFESYLGSGTILFNGDVVLDPEKRRKRGMIAVEKCLPGRRKRERESLVGRN